jgi:hypothetical protein
LPVLRVRPNVFSANTDAAAILIWINVQAASKGPPKRVSTFESYRYTNIIDTIVETGKAATRLFKAEPLYEVGRCDDKFNLESSTKVTRTESCLIRQRLD